MTAPSEIDKLAKQVAVEASRDDITLTDRVEALKALTGYLSALQKGRRRADDDEPADTVNFDQFRRTAAEADDGRENRGRSSRVNVGRRDRVRTIRNGETEPN